MSHFFSFSSNHPLSPYLPIPFTLFFLLKRGTFSKIGGELWNHTLFQALSFFLLKSSSRWWSKTAEGVCPRGVRFYECRHDSEVDDDVKLHCLHCWRIVINIFTICYHCPGHERNARTLHFHCDFPHPHSNSCFLKFL